jgi:hypothetical protein
MGPVTDRRVAPITSAATPRQMSRAAAKAKEAIVAIDALMAR